MSLDPRTHDPSLATFEQASDSGDVVATQKLAQIAYNMNPRDPALLRRTKDRLRKLPRGEWKTDWLLAIFSVLSDDVNGWNEALGALGYKADPSLGYNAYQNLRSLTSDKAVLERWFVVVEHSAKLGHLLARRDVFERKISARGWWAPAAKGLFRLLITSQMLVLLLRDKNDPRLPISARGLRHRSPVKSDDRENRQ